MRDLEEKKLTDEMLDSIAGGAIYYNKARKGYEILNDTTGEEIWFYGDHIPNVENLAQIKAGKVEGQSTDFLTDDQYWALIAKRKPK